MQQQDQNAWEGVMKKHAKSFYLASLFFPKKLMPRVKALYALCRWLDDAVDEAPNPVVAQKNLEQIAQDLVKDQPQLPVNQLYRNNGLDPAYIEDLIDGARDDMKLVRIQTEQELIQYCYKVAGTVGLAMFDLMKVTSPLAKPHAVDLGIAMQITNISRDIQEDLQRNRIYIPESLLKKHDLRAEDLFNNTYSEQKIILVTQDLLALADRYYQSASLAYNSIPWRTRGAIIIASRLYQGIGHKLLRQGGNPMKGRTYLTKWEKVFSVSKSIVYWTSSPLLRRSRLIHNPQLHTALKPWKQLRGFEI